MKLNTEKWVLFVLHAGYEFYTTGIYKFRRNCGNLPISAQQWLLIKIIRQRTPPEAGKNYPPMVPTWKPE